MKRKTVAQKTKQTTEAVLPRCTHQQPFGVARFTAARSVMPRQSMTTEERRSHSAALQELRRRLQEVADAGNPAPLEMYTKAKSHKDIHMWLQKFKEDRDFHFVQET